MPAFDNRGDMKRALSSFIVLAILLLCGSPSAFSAEYHCEVIKKFNSDHMYSKAEIKKWQFSVNLEDNGHDSFISRCSFSETEKKVTCDRHQVNHIAYDEKTRIKKYYYFLGQLNFQFFPTLLGIEDNGRGDIAFTKCKLARP